MDELKLPTIDISQLITTLLRKWVLILCAGVLSAVVAFAYSSYCITPIYRASSTMLVDMRNSIHENLTSEKLNLAEKYASTIAYIMRTNTVLQPVIEELNLKESSASLASKIKITTVSETMLLRVSVEHPDKDTALAIIKVLDKTAPEIINEQVTSGYILEIESPTVSSAPVSPNVTKNTVFGFLIGVIVTAFIIIVIRLLNNRVKSVAELQNLVDLPVLGVIPRSVRKVEQKSKGE